MKFFATNSRKFSALAHLNRSVVRGQQSLQVDVLAINHEDQQTGRARFRSCSHQHRSVYPGLDSELFACHIPFDARFLHSYHVASVQAHVSVNLVDGAVCVDSVLVTA